MVACFGICKLFNNLHDSHRILEQPFFYVIPLVLPLFQFNPPSADWTFDLPAMP